MKISLVTALLIAGANAICPLGHTGENPHEVSDANTRHLRSVFENVESDDYQAHTRAEKKAYITSKIASTPNPADWLNVVEMAALFTEDMHVTEDHAADEFPKSSFFQRKKVIHSVGASCEVDITWDSNPYSGLFHGADTALFRMASAQEPSYSKSDAEAAGFTPGFGIKVLRDGVPSGNIVALHTLTAQDSYNAFKYPMSNHLSAQNLGSKLDLVAKKFGTVSDWPNYLGLSDFARYTQEGDDESSVINFPFQLIFMPDEELQSKFPDSGTNLDLFKTQLSTLEPGQHLYSIMAKDSYEGAMFKIGDITTKTNFVESAYADQTMFLQHTRYDDDIKIRPDLLKGCDDAHKCLVCPVDVACT